MTRSWPRYRSWRSLLIQPTATKSGSEPRGLRLMCRSRFRSRGLRRPSMSCSRNSRQTISGNSKGWPTNRRIAPDRTRPGARKANEHSARLRSRPALLLDLGFLEVDVLAHDRVVLLEAQLLGLGARVLLRHIEEARVCGADELDLDGCRLGHRRVPNA